MTGEPELRNLAPKLLVGVRLRMSRAADRTGELFAGFMPRRREIVNTAGPDIFCVQRYGEDYSFDNFDPAAGFEKWAAMEVSAPGQLPADMEALEMEGGLYAVFNHRGGPAAAPGAFRYIFHEWLPRSDYCLDDRPHFEILGEKYKHSEPDSEEEIWIPVKPRNLHLMEDLENPFPEPVDLEITDSIDLHSFSPKEVRRVVEAYLEEARKKGFKIVRIIHGKGIGVQREMVRKVLSETDFVKSFKSGDEFSGGWGATVVKFTD